jgi:hypothetical protein
MALETGNKKAIGRNARKFVEQKNVIYPPADPPISAINKSP